ncbi:MAG TPA: protein-signal peptide and transmembrane prediction, partial [Planctomycetaceae bacterium]|nr:protein-signal peptide and transmembrane prediction [Planctomycetaceae bacterium]
MQTMWMLLLLTVLSMLPQQAAGQTPELLKLQARTRSRVAADSTFWHSTNQTIEWQPGETCVVVCDMWDNHWCRPSAERVAELAPQMNEVLQAARARGLLIIHCPSDTLDFYKDTPQRRLA